MIRAGSLTRHVSLLTALIFLGSLCVFSQQPSLPSQEISEEDGQPVLIKHLPDYDQVGSGAVFVTDKAALRAAVNNEAVLDVLDRQHHRAVGAHLRHHRPRRALEREDDAGQSRLRRIGRTAGQSRYE